MTRKKQPKVRLMCSDCGFPAREVTKAVLAQGSSVRDPGEALCGSCSSHRVKLVRQLDALPNNIHTIRAKRMAVGVK